MMTARELSRKFLWIAGFALVFFLVLTLRFHSQSSRSFRQGEASRENGETELAIAWYDQSIRAHSILDGPGKRSAERLEELARDYEQQGKWQSAVETWQTLLSALSATQNGWPGKRRARIDELIVKVETMRREIAAGEKE